MTIYAIPGLGADDSVVENLSLKCSINVLDWISPLHKEGLRQYAIRMAKQIDSSKPFILMGVSFGGMLATEISKIIRPKKLILISSTYTSKNLPYLIRNHAFKAIFQLLPSPLLILPKQISFWAFGVTAPHHQKQLISIIDNTDKKFIKWAVLAISQWQNDRQPNNLLQLHGSKDRIIAAPRTYFQVITNAGHFAIVSQAEKISSKINQAIK